MPAEPAAGPAAGPVLNPEHVAVLGQARAYFEEFAAGYDEAADEADWRLNGRLAASLVDVGPVTAVLDLACGTGTTLAELQRSLPGAELVGVDISAAMLRLAADRVPAARLVRSDAASFVAAAAGPFDVVTAVGGFEFTPDLPGLLDGVRRLVRPGGHLVFTYEPVLDAWPPQSLRVETNLGSSGLELTTFRWEPGEATGGFDGWRLERHQLLTAYLRDGLPTVYGWVHYRRPGPETATT
ncbi:MAG TPA: class I SAM-dependent methyltransferase [Acidimicrobiales bacterium]